jgi:signal transduction histidine kinase
LPKDIQVIKEFAETPEIECYPMELNQVFTCILLNSIEAITGPGKIRIQTRLEDGWLQVRVTDSGKGIAPGDLDKIFDPGFTTKGVGVGTGMGLPTCRKIMDRHGGRIDVASQLGTGTSVTLRLPLRPSSQTRL